MCIRDSRCNSHCGHATSSRSQTMRSIYSLLSLAVSMLVLIISTVSAQSTRPDELEENTAAVRKGVITGKVINESGQPLSDAQVSVRAYGSGAVSYTHLTLPTSDLV